MNFLGTQVGVPFSKLDLVSLGVYDLVFDKLDEMNGQTFGAFAIECANGHFGVGGLTYTPGGDPVVPIPPTVLLMGSGLLGLVGLGWRRRKTKV
jgi:hypothetical protein